MIDLSQVYNPILGVRNFWLLFTLHFNFKLAVAKPK